MLTFDTHCDTPLMLLGGTFDMGLRHPSGTLLGGQVDLPRMEEGGLQASVFAMYVEQGPLTEMGRGAAWAKLQRFLGALNRMFQDQGSRCGLARGAMEAERIAATGRRAIFLGMENAYPLGLDLARLDACYARGVRCITLAHNTSNDVCASATDPEVKAGRDAGLSAFGREVLARMNELGMVVDISHISPASVADVLRLGTTPVMASHSSVRALCDHARNLDDGQIRAIAARGGVVQICPVPDFLKQAPADPHRFEATWALWQRVERYLDQPGDAREAEALEMDWQAFRRDHGDHPATVSDLVDHIDHVVGLVGDAYVGIGSDFDGGGGLADCGDVGELPRIDAELRRRGHSEAAIARIRGGNALRAFREALRA